ncbi:MAG: hypothetical protein LBE91_07135 [Tannerella sp.]|nr:hypothetical protein [Tannerella sp.]
MIICNFTLDFLWEAVLCSAGNASLTCGYESLAFQAIGVGLSSSNPVRDYRSVENVFRSWLHSIRNASCGWLNFLPSDASLREA